MVSDEWWVFHLTETGWIDGDYKHDFQKEVSIDAPKGTILTRKYFETLGHPHASMKVGFEDIGGISERAKEVLKTFPYPKGFERFLP